jgi:hypothetical protein
MLTSPSPPSLYTNILHDIFCAVQALKALAEDLYKKVALSKVMQVWREMCDNTLLYTCMYLRAFVL